MTSRRILFTAEYFKTHFLSAFVFIYTLQNLVLLYANFRELSWKVKIVPFILHHPVIRTFGQKPEKHGKVLYMG